MTAKNKVIFKPKVAKAIADFIVDKKYNEDMSDDAARACLVTAHFFEDKAFAEGGKYAILRDIPNDDIMGAMIRGYEAEKTPEDKVREYYEARRRDFGMLHNVGMLKAAEADGMRDTLDILGIKIGGINA